MPGQRRGRGLDGRDSDDGEIIFMFWTLLLCHFLADYVLQTEAIVRAKKRLPGLLLHAWIHLLTMLVLVVGLLGADARMALPWIVTLAAVHFVIDLWKNVLANLKPGWVIFGYLQDQVLHLFSILLVAYGMELSGGPPMFIIERSWVIPATAFVLVTHTWFITERILAHEDASYQTWVSAQSWTRMVGRALMYSGFLAGWNLWGLLMILGGLTYHYLDLAGAYRFRALLADACVVAAVAALSRWALVAG